MKKIILNSCAVLGITFLAACSRPITKDSLVYFSSSASDVVAASSSEISLETYFNSRFSYSLTFPDSYYVLNDTMYQNDNIADAIRIIPNSVRVKVFDKSNPLPARKDFSDADTWNLATKLFASASEPLEDFAKVSFNTFIITKHAHLKISPIEQSNLNGIPSYMYTVDYTADWKEKGGIQSLQQTCHAMENKNKDKILLCFISKAPTIYSNTQAAKVIAESFTLTE